MKILCPGCYHWTPSPRRGEILICPECKHRNEGICDHHEVRPMGHGFAACGECERSLKFDSKEDG